jgi:hypothetical protein
MVIAIATPASAQPAGMGPPGRASFLSTGAAQWDVLVDGRAQCTTPCALHVEPGRWVKMRTRTGVQLDVGHIRGDVVVQAEPRSAGMFITGLTFTALGGTAVITGISLWGVGCFVDDREGMCKAGKITFGSGAAVTVGGLFLMWAGRARLDVLPANTTPYVSDRGVGLAGTF